MMRALALALALLLAGPARGQEAPLDEAIDAALASLRVPNAKVGVAVHSLRAGKPVYARGADQALLLASNTKLFTTGAALAKLGPEFRFRTPLALAGEKLHVFGGGDPNLSGRFHDGDPVAVFKRWAAKLREAGVAQVSDVVLHTGAFEGPNLNPGWKPYEGWRWYVAPFGPLSLNDNCVDLTFEPTREGEPCRVTLSPDTRYVTLAGQVKTARRPERPLVILRPDGSNAVTLRGETGAKDSYSVAVHDPTRFFGTVLLETLAREGISVTGRLEESLRPLEEIPGLREIDVFESPLLPTLAACNQPSQNFYAEMILRVLGWKLKGRGSLEHGLDAVREWAVGEVGCSSLVQADGSGLTRENRASAADVVRLLLHLLDRHKDFAGTLAVNGAEKGTLRRRLSAPDVKGRVRAKTGHLAGVSTLSGFVDAAGGDVYVFSILVNAPDDASAGNADAVQNRLVELLARRKGE
jgi:D-alanyl-D-alanine carboxypeptidase/D-alanyl-D-alanine-endopeptidase (penicillin-binding protein 4)